MTKLALITGSNKGIGNEIAYQLGKKGFHIILSGRDESRLNSTLNKFQTEKISSEILMIDVSREDSIRNAANIFSKSNRKLDVLINNAGIAKNDDDSILNNDFSILNETLNTNSFGPLRVIQSFLPYINSPGRIINISSGGGSMTDSVGGWSPNYCVSKSLLNALTRHLAFELIAKKISVNSVCPGWVRTDMGGSGASRSVEQGAETPVWLATNAPSDLTGKFFRDKKEIPW